MTRKGHIATNTLAVCDRNMQFVYFLALWEGSACDSRVLRHSVSQINGLKVPQGCYYLCDNAYANSNGFLTPYRGVRYHLMGWGPDTDAPQNPKELFNMRHTKARNVIEQAFVVLKMRWGILRSASFYPIQTQIRLIMTCFYYIILFARKWQ
ncbi:protein ANTAGONIST OF LIKE HETEROCHROMATIN PROTEIN 1-like [Salvia splendens]|uniref:protein ANTAGONIST OF LIKE HETEROCHROMATIN PROTEIN 1-like n=1 Tax=Salvia splendens TaxID=180675 RepID=UPI001C27078D|nr:protein ANTAGONIST OF LIKE HETEROCHROMATIN PROTEIN 1-like [Salvia splendens]